MLSHWQVWRAIDALAKKYELTASGLARRAGLDPTTFNKSKRFTPSGRERWPSTESLAKILAATGASFDELSELIEPSERTRNRPASIPLIGLAQAGNGGFFSDGGFPVGGCWEAITFPEINDPNAYALEISGDSMQPLFRDGDVIIISPNAGLRRGDRVVVKTSKGEVMAKLLARQTAHTIELHSLNPDHDNITLKKDQVEWIARIVWASL